MKKSSSLEPVNVKLPSPVTTAVATIKAQTKKTLEQIYAEGMQSFVLRYQRERGSISYTEDADLQVLFNDPEIGKTLELSEKPNTPPRRKRDRFLAFNSIGAGWDIEGSSNRRKCRHASGEATWHGS